MKQMTTVWILGALLSLGASAETYLNYEGRVFSKNELEACRVEVWQVKTRLELLDEFSVIINECRELRKQNEIIGYQVHLNYLRRGFTSIDRFEQAFDTKATCSTQIEPLSTGLSSIGREPLSVYCRADYQEKATLIADFYQKRLGSDDDRFTMTTVNDFKTLESLESCNGFLREMQAILVANEFKPLMSSCSKVFDRWFNPTVSFATLSHLSRQKLSGDLFADKSSCTVKAAAVSGKLKELGLRVLFANCSSYNKEFMLSVSYFDRLIFQKVNTLRGSFSREKPQCESERLRIEESLTSQGKPVVHGFCEKSSMIGGFTPAIYYFESR